MLKGGRWERSYGFVGHATIARVPASEIEFSPDRNRRLNLPGGLSARLETAEPPVGVLPAGPADPGHAPSLQRPRGRAVGADGVRPRRGRRQAGPAPGGVAGPAARSPKVTTVSPAGVPATALRKPIADGPVRPRRRVPDAGADRILRGVRLDLNDWYAGLKPGGYWLHLTFGADSGIGEGTTNEMAFWIVEPDKPGR